MYRFPDRLFDRDTLFLEHFNVNLLYLMSLYANNDPYEQDAFRRIFRQDVHDRFREMLLYRYRFFRVTPPDGVSVADFVQTDFYRLNGRIYIPNRVEGRFLLAFEVGSAACEETIKMMREEKGAKIVAINHHNSDC